MVEMVVSFFLCGIKCDLFEIVKSVGIKYDLPHEI